MPHVRPMIVAIWCGQSKPNSLKEYLQMFINELKDLMENGLTTDANHISVKFESCICDTPARSFLKGIQM